MAEEEFAGDMWEKLMKQAGMKPGEPDYHNNMGLSHRERGEWEAAIVEFREAIRLKPSDVLFHCNLASALAAKGEYNEALSEYGEALRLAPNDYLTHFNLGNLLSKLERTEEAVAEYQKAIQIEPDRADAHYNLSNLYLRQERLEEAVPHYEQVIADPKAAVAMNARLQLGWICIKQQLWQKAEEHLMEVERQRPDEFLANYYLAHVYLNMEAGNFPSWVLPAKALLHAKKAVELQPEDEDAKQVARAALDAFERTKPPEQT